MGVDFNSMTLIMSIDTGKIQEALVLCFAFLAKQEVTLKFMQKLMGKVFYSIRCTQAARHFTNRLLDLLKLARCQNTVNFTHEARLDAYWITAFLPHFNGKTVMKLTDAERAVFVDACLTGAGGYCRGHGYYKLVFPQALTDCKFCIAALEAFNLLVALRLWAKEWEGLKIVVYTDNYASVCAAASGAAQDPTHTRGLQRSLVVVHTKLYLYDSTAQTRRSDGGSRPPQPGRHQRSFLGSVADFPGAVRRTGKASVEQLATSPTSYLGMGEQPRFSSGFRSLLAIAYSSSKFLHLNFSFNCQIHCVPDSPLERLALAAMNRRRQAYRPAMLKNYQSAQKLYLQFCLVHNIDVSHPSELDLAAYASTKRFVVFHGTQPLSSC